MPLRLKKNRSLTVRLPEDMHSEVLDESTRTGKSRSEIVRLALLAAKQEVTPLAAAAPDAPNR